MSNKREYTSDASISMSIAGNRLFIHHCDAEGRQGTEEFGNIEDYESRRDMTHWVSVAIEEYAADLAESIVNDLYDRILQASEISE